MHETSENTKQLKLIVMIKINKENGSWIKYIDKRMNKNRQV
jgi:hypothetical protein